MALDWLPADDLSIGLNLLPISTSFSLRLPLQLALECIFLFRNMFGRGKVLV